MKQRSADGPRRRLGDFGERVAATLLESRGFRILDRNWRCRAGEIDLVAARGDLLTFVEVRTRRGGEFGSPEETITLAKQRRLMELACTYIQQHEGDSLPSDWRIDLVAVELDERSVVTRIELIENVAGW